MIRFRSTAISGLCFRCQNRQFYKNKKKYSYTLPIQVCAAQRGCDFEAPDLERGIHFRGVFWNGYNISNARKLQFCKQPFEIIQGQIAFKNTVQCKQTVVLFAP